MKAVEICVIIAAVSLVLFTIIYNAVKRHKRKKNGGSSCGGCCDCCSGCASVKKDERKK